MSGVELSVIFGAYLNLTEEWTFPFKSPLRRGTLLRGKGSGMSSQLPELTSSAEDYAGGKSALRGDFEW